ncbi:MAG: hypothetical protein R2684_15050 [Pyrinomonadaceae bacterium]
MSRIVVETEREAVTAPLADYGSKKRSGRFWHVLKIAGATSFLICLAVAVAGFVYYQYLKTTPQYSLALLVEAARSEDQETIDKIVDVDAVVDDFVPQITGKAVELYGKGLPKETVTRISKVAAPILPFVKERARAEIPGLLREKTSALDRVPFYGLVFGAGKYLDIKTEGDKAVVQSKSGLRSFELHMEKIDGVWKIVGVRDEALATKIAQRIGQQIIAVIQKGEAEIIERLGKRLGLDNLGDILEKAGDAIGK